MDEKFVIEARYEIFTIEGKKFVNWFTFKNKPLTEKEAKEEIKKIKRDFGYIDTKTHLQHEYRLKSYIEYENELKAFKDNIKLLEEKQKEYYKSEEYKELQRKKRIAKKKLKEKQKKYLEEHAKPAN